MAQIPERYLEGLQFAAGELKSLLRPEDQEDQKVVHKGLLLYHQGLVHQLKYEGDQITAVVQDVTPVRVSLDLEFINHSECSCPHEGFCRHRMAAFFYLLSQGSSVAAWLNDWRQPVKETKTAALLGLKTARDLLKANKQQQEPDYDNWKSSIEESFDKILMGQGDPKPYVMAELFQVHLRRLRAAAPVEQEWRLLYMLIAHIVSFKKLISLSMELGYFEDTINRYYRHLFHLMTEEAADITGKLTVQSVPFAFDEFIGKLKEETSELLTNDFEIEYERTHLYRLLWTHLFKSKEWREEEVNKLNSLQDEPSMPLVVGVTHLHILLREDEEAMQNIQVPNAEMTPYLLYWLDYFTALKEWKRMAPFAEVFVSRLKEYLSWNNEYNASMDFSRMALKALRPYIGEMRRPDLYEKAMIQTLPYSYREYEDVLFEQENYEKWAELQAYIGFDISMLPSERIKRIQQAEPEILLGLYHQSVQGHINMKNRDHYREAVRKMKKLRTIYKKLKRLNDWELFLEMILERTRRLRAFHEECKRGKLIDA